MGEGIGSTERGSGAELVSSNPGVPRQRFDKPGVLPAAGDPGEEVLLLASEAAHAGIGGGTATDCANIAGAVAEDVLQIHFRGADLRLPGTVDLDAVAAVLRSIQTV